MSELRVMAQDITKNSSDIENYSKEFVELQSQLNQVSKEKFNGISLFAFGHGAAAASANYTGGNDNATYKTSGGLTLNYDKYSRSLITHDSGVSAAGSVQLNVTNLEFALSLGSTGDLATGTTISDITTVAVSQFTEVIERIANARAENGAEQNRIMQTMDLLQSNLTNIEAAHGRIMDTDIALESTRFARHNVLVQASAAMTAQANQLTNVALQLLG